MSAAWTLRRKSTDKHGLLEEDHRTSPRNGRSHFVVRLPALQLFPFGLLHLVGIDGTRRQQPQKEETLQQVGVRWSQYEWRAPNRTLVLQISVNANEAKVFEAHAALLGLCDNLSNALKLLANQQTDGDSPIQSIVTGLHEKAENTLWTGWEVLSERRSFIRTDNRSAAGVGHLRQGTTPLHVQKHEF